MTSLDKSERQKFSWSSFFLKIDNSTPNDASRQTTLRKLKFESFLNDSFLKMAQKVFFSRDDRFDFSDLSHLISHAWDFVYFSELFVRHSHDEVFMLKWHLQLKWTTVAGKEPTKCRVHSRTLIRVLKPMSEVSKDIASVSASESWTRACVPTFVRKVLSVFAELRWNQTFVPEDLCGHHIGSDLDNANIDSQARTRKIRRTLVFILAK